MSMFSMPPFSVAVDDGHVPHAPWGTVRRRLLTGYTIVWNDPQAQLATKYHIDKLCGTKPDIANAKKNQRMAFWV